MSRSRKKPWDTLTPRWPKHKERGFRRQIKDACREAAMDFDPDADFDELHQSHKHSGEEPGTRCGFPTPPDESEETWMHEEYERQKRK
jgi:hypothetical protein